MSKLNRNRTSWMLVALLFFAALINYVDRGSLSVAVPRIGPELSLSPTRIGFLLSAFFWSYTFFQILSGWLADRYPVAWEFGIGFVVWSAATVGSGFAAGLWSLAFARFMLGVGESVSYPCFSKIIAAGFPIERRGLPNSLLDAGTKLGPAVGTLIGGLLVARYGWRVMFICLGGMSLLWLIPWVLYGPRPAKSQQTAGLESGPTMLQVMRRMDAWGTFLGNFSYTYGYYFLLTWLPEYLVRARHVSLETMGVLGSIPYWGSAISAVICGWISDRMIRQGASPTRVRKGFVISGLLLSTAMVPAALVENLSLSVMLISLAYVAFGMYASNHWAITQTLAGVKAAGTWSGLKNMVGNSAGIIAPVATGMLVERTGSFLWAFISPAVVAVLGVCCYLFLIGPVAPVQWENDSLQPASEQSADV